MRAGSNGPNAAPLGAPIAWENETEERFFSYSDELAPGLGEGEAGACSATELPGALAALEPAALLTPAQLARRASYRRVVAHAMAGLSLFTVGVVTARLVLGL